MHPSYITNCNCYNKLLRLVTVISILVCTFYCRLLRLVTIISITFSCQCKYNSTDRLYNRVQATHSYCTINKLARYRRYDFHPTITKDEIKLAFNFRVKRFWVSLPIIISQIGHA